MSSTRYYVSMTSNLLGLTERDAVRISTDPCRHHSSGKAVIEGSCAARDNSTLTAFGEFDTIEAARTYAQTELLEGDYREVSATDADDRLFADPSVVVAYRPGSIPMLSAEESVNLTSDFRDADITLDTTDEQIAQMAKALSDESVGHGGSRLDVPAVVIAAIKHRNGLVGEFTEEAAA